MKNLFLFALTLLLMASCSSNSEEGTANFSVSNNTDWSFALGDNTEAKNPNFSVDDWRILDLPHDWSIEGEYSPDNPMGNGCGYLPAGIAWYRKSIEVPAEWKGQQVEIEFDGVFMNSTVYANGKELGTHPYGWTSFAYDLTDLVAQESKITFAVRVDNDLQPSARWYTGSGIYAPSRFNIKGGINIPRHGVFVKTNGGKVSAEVKLCNLTGSTQDIDISYEVVDAKNHVVASLSQGLSLKKKDLVTPELMVKEAELWDLDTPTLYHFVTTLSQNGKVLHQEKTRFGFRDIAWKAETGFWLNGRNVKLQGVCNHQDAGALGAAVPEKINRFRIQQLKDMGCNAIRVAHNPQTPDFYRSCDELGMLVMDEIFDGWLRKASQDYGARFFDEYWESDMTEWLERNRNHPSIVIYSLGNETHGAIAKELIALGHKLDSTRPYTSGDSNMKDMDVYGVNGRSEKKGFFDQPAMKRSFIATENPHTWQVRGYYRSKTWYRDGYPNKRQKPFWTPDLTEEEVFHDSWTKAENFTSHKQIFNSSYDNATVRITARKSIEQLRDVPYYAGNFRWTGHDYIGEAGYVHGGWPYRAFMGGAIDLANFEKDLFYLYQSQWTTTPMVHILPHWTHPKIKEGTEIPVWVYTNGDEAELFLNGKSLGKQKPGKMEMEMQLQWLVPYQAGELKAISFEKGKKVAESIIKTASAPTQIVLSVDGEGLAAEGKDIVQVRVSSQDKDGNFYPYGENRTYFHVLGAGHIKALDNGSPIDVESHYGTHSRIAFYGLTRAYIESEKNADPIALVAASIVGEKKLMSSKEVHIAVEQIDLRGKNTKADVKVYYTIDGSTPNLTSPLYTDAFEVKLGTDVKAAVYINGEEALQMEERFSENVGFIYEDDTKMSITTGEQAELATITGGKKANKMKGYKGKGYVELQKKGASIEWYLENDGPTVKTNYSFFFYNPNPEQIHSTLNINGVEYKLLLDPAKKQRWSKSMTINAPYKSGANTVTLTYDSELPLYIDYLLK